MDSPIKIGGLFGIGNLNVDKIKEFADKTNGLKTYVDAEITPALTNPNKSTLKSKLSVIKSRLIDLNKAFKEANQSRLIGGKRTRRARGSRSKTYKKRH